MTDLLIRDVSDDVLDMMRGPIAEVTGQTVERLNLA